MNLQEQLAPLILPPPPSLWPLAPGWWGIIVITGALVVLKIRHYYRQRQQHPHEPLSELPPQTPTELLDSLRQTALEELAQLPKPQPGEPASQWLQQINALLKRITRIRYPAANSHTLSGRAWLAFLDSRCPAAGLTRWMILVEGAYRSECHLDQNALDGLEQAVSIWIQKHA